MKYQYLMVLISTSLYNTESEILKANPNDLDESKKKNQRMLNKSQLLEKFYAGQTDEQYVKDYYEILRKSDEFIRNATPHQMAVAADKHGSNYGMKDRYGRRYEHYGFFDDKHKNSGKTLGEVIESEFEDRRTKDDDYEIMYIFNNNPIGAGLAQAVDGFKTEDNQISKTHQFPIRIVRDDSDVINKIEELTEYLHVKKIGFEHRQLEFFIPLKYKTNDIDDDSKIFKEIIGIKQVFVRDDYGRLIGFGIDKYKERIINNDTHEVLRFNGVEMEIVNKK